MSQLAYFGPTEQLSRVRPNSWCGQAEVAPAAGATWTALEHFAAQARPWDALRTSADAERV